MKKIVLILLGIIILVIIGSVCYLKFALPNVGKAPVITIHATPAQIERGKYLANHVSVCMDCHSTRDWTKFSGPIVSGTLGKGGEYFGPEFGFPGKFYSKNITPYYLKNWTDGEIFRAITTGVDKDGKALFPIMPYQHFGVADSEDILAIIAYLRTLTPIVNDVSVSKANFPMNFILNTIPKKANFSKKPDPSDQLKYGAYLTNLSGCIECHTQEDKGTIIPSLAFSGGREFQLPNGILRSANITPDRETGIGNWTAEDFVAKFKYYSNPDAAYKMAPHAVNTVMPWVMYSGMDSSDLKAIYAYLRTVKPIRNQVILYQENTAK